MTYLTYFVHSPYRNMFLHMYVYAGMHPVATHDKILVTFNTEKVNQHSKYSTKKEFQSQPIFLCHITLLRAGFTNGVGEREKITILAGTVVHVTKQNEIIFEKSVGTQHYHSGSMDWINKGLFLTVPCRTRVRRQQRNLGGNRFKTVKKEMVLMQCGQALQHFFQGAMGA